MPKIERGVAIRNRDELAESFQARKYNDHELENFHNKIQRFWDEPREVVVPGWDGPQIARKFRHEDLHVAFGAAKKVEHGVNSDKQQVYKYMYNSDRYTSFANLWRQYEDWQRKKDWIYAQNTPTLTKMSEEAEVPF